MSVVLFFVGLAVIAVGIGFIYLPAGIVAAGVFLCVAAVLLREVPDASARSSARPSL